MAMKNTKARREQRELHNLYDKHEMVPVCAVMVKGPMMSGWAYLTVCECGGAMGCSEGFPGPGRVVDKFEAGVADSRYLHEDWVDVTIHAIAHNALLREAYERLPYPKKRRGVRLTTEVRELKRLEKKYGIKGPRR
jgi:hypothetical protein